jgi:hypothetical protein
MACSWFYVSRKREYTCVALNVAHPFTHMFEAVKEDRVGWTHLRTFVDNLCVLYTLKCSRVTHSTLNHMLF